MTKKQKQTLDKLCVMQRDFAKMYRVDLQEDSYVGLCSIGDEYVMLLPEFLRKIFGDQVKPLERAQIGKYFYAYAEYNGVKFVSIEVVEDDEI